MASPTVRPRRIHKALGGGAARSAPRLLLLFAGALALVAFAACRSPPPPRYGEPVGIRIESAGRWLDVGAAVREGEDLRPHLDRLAGALAKAASGCPIKGEVGLQLEVVGGAIRVPGPTGDGVERCLAEALQGKAIGDPALPPLHVRLRLALE